MKKITILKKDNGEVTQIERVKLIKNTPYLTGKELCFNTVINQEKVRKSKQEIIEEANRCVNLMIDEILRFENGIGIYKLMSQLQNAKSREDLVELIKSIETAYRNIVSYKNKYGYSTIESMRNSNIHKLDEILNKRPDLVMSITIKKIISGYFFKKLMSLDNQTIKELENAKNSEKDISVLFDEIGITFIENAKENGVYELSKKYLSDTIDIVFDEKQKHLCFDCQEAHPGQCQKITECVFHKINNYDYITDGYQIFDELGNIDRFIVTSCENFMPDRQKPPLTSEEFERIRKIKNAMYMIYYDAESVDEAEKIQKYIESKKTLKYNRVIK